MIAPSRGCKIGILENELFDQHRMEVGKLAILLQIHKYARKYRDKCNAFTLELSRRDR